jgi:hypothetical protein
MYQTFPAVEGAEYIFSTYALTTCEEDPIQGSNDNYATAKLVFHDNVGAEIAFAETTIVDSTSPVGTWTKHTVIATAPAGADSVLAYILFIQPSTLDGAVWVDDLSLVEDPPTGIEGSTPLDIGLQQNVPNPFNPTTTIRYSIAERGHVTLKIYNAAGELVRKLVDEVQSPGHGEFSETWNGTNDKGQRVSSGVYFYRLTSKGLTQTKKMVLLK